MAAVTTSPAMAQATEQPDPPKQSAKGLVKEAGTGKDKAKPNASQIQQLIEKLGSNRFQERDAASAQLLDIGEPALLPLSTAERGHDAEVSARAKAIRERIEYERFETIALKFTRDPDPAANYGLPGWKSFSSAAGTSRPAKRLFLKMLEDRAIVALCLESLDKGQVPDGVFEGLPEDPEARLRAVIGKTCSEIRNNIFALGKSPEAGDLITMLVVVQALKDTPMEVHETARMLCNMGALSRLMAMPGAAPCGRKIAGAWFLKTPVSYGSEVLSWARQHRIPEARNVALRMLDSQIENEFKVDAFLSLAIFGTPEDLPTIDKFIDDQTVVDEFNPPIMPGDVRVEAQGPLNNPLKDGGFQYRQTLGDLALVAGAKIVGLELEKLFPVIRITENTGPVRTTIGFSKQHPEDRQNAVKLYREARSQAVQPAS